MSLAESDSLDAGSVRSGKGESEKPRTRRRQVGNFGVSQYHGTMIVYSEETERGPTNAGYLIWLVGPGKASA